MNIKCGIHFKIRWWCKILQIKISLICQIQGQRPVRKGTREKMYKHIWNGGVSRNFILSILQHLFYFCRCNKFIIFGQAICCCMLDDQKKNTYTCFNHATRVWCANCFIFGLILSLRTLVGACCCVVDIFLVAHFFTQIEHHTSDAYVTTFALAIGKQQMDKCTQDTWYAVQKWTF